MRPAERTALQAAGWWSGNGILSWHYARNSLRGIVLESAGFDDGKSIQRVKGFPEPDMHSASGMGIPRRMALAYRPSAASTRLRSPVRESRADTQGSQGQAGAGICRRRRKGSRWQRAGQAPGTLHAARPLDCCQSMMKGHSTLL